MNGRFFLFGIALLFLTLGSSFTARADSYTETIDSYQNLPTVQPFFKSAYGYAVFPTVGKGGFVIGGAYGKGMVFRGGKLSGETSLIKATFGAQLGGQAFSEIIFFQDRRAYEEFTRGDFEFDATASAVAVTAGAQAKAGTEGATASANAGPEKGKQYNVGYRKGMAVFIQIKGGFMYEASIGGQRFNFKPLN